jgi:rhodanese-related sulfurtransferase
LIYSVNKITVNRVFALFLFLENIYLETYNIDKLKTKFIMKKCNLLLFTFLMSFMFILSSCGNGESPKAKEENTNKEVKVEKSNEFTILSEYLKTNGNYINAAQDQGGAPQFIEATELNDLLGGYVLILDLRSPKAFAEGHISGAENVSFGTLVNYMKDEVSVDDYDKIVMVCYTGQTSGMATSVLRMMGYNTVYCLKWGMSSWNMKFAEPKWLARISDDYVDAIETTDNPKPAAGDFPEISTGNTDPKEILTEQANRLFAKGFGKMTAKIADVMGDPSAYYIINIATPEAYAAGHIPSAVNYAPKGSLAYDVDLNTLPTDKPILVYCATGQYAAQVVAYLRLLGYDAYTLLYGANSFMHKVLLEKGIHAFTKEVVNNFEYEESDFTGGAAEEEGGGGC